MKKTLFILITLLICHIQISYALSNHKKEDKTPITADSIINTESEKINKTFRNYYPRQDLTKKLNLNKQQEQQVLEIYRESHPHVMELILQMSKLQAQIEEQYTADEEKIRQILNSQQNFQLDKLQRQNLRNRGIKPIGEKPSRKRMRPTSIY